MVREKCHSQVIRTSSEVEVSRDLRDFLSGWSDWRLKVFLCRWVTGTGQASWQSQPWAGLVGKVRALWRVLKNKFWFGKCNSLRLFVDSKSTIQYHEMRPTWLEEQIIYPEKLAHRNFLNSEVVNWVGSLSSWEQFLEPESWATFALAALNLVPQVSCEDTSGFSTQL